MKKTGNILLVISFSLNLLIFILSIIMFIRSVSRYLTGTWGYLTETWGVGFFVYSVLLPGFVVLLSSIPAVLLFVGNLKNNHSVVLPIICLVIGTLIILFLMLSLLPPILQYIVLRSVNLIDNAVFLCAAEVIMYNKFLLWPSCLTLISGGIISLIEAKRSNQNEA